VITHLVVPDEVVDGVEAHVVDQVVLGLATLRLGVDPTMVVPTVTPTNQVPYQTITGPPELELVLLTRTGVPELELVLLN